MSLINEGSISLAWTANDEGSVHICPVHSDREHMDIVNIGLKVKRCCVCSDEQMRRSIGVRLTASMMTDERKKRKEKQKTPEESEGRYIVHVPMNSRSSCIP